MLFLPGTKEACFAASHTSSRRRPLFHSRGRADVDVDVDVDFTIIDSIHCLVSRSGRHLLFHSRQRADIDIDATTIIGLALSYLLVQRCVRYHSNRHRHHYLWFTPPCILSLVSHEHPLFCVRTRRVGGSRPVPRAALPAGVREVGGGVCPVIEGGVPRPDEQGTVRPEKVLRYDLGNVHR